MHELHRILIDAAEGRFPAVDGAVEVLVPMPGDHHAVVEFTGHAFVLTDRVQRDVVARGADGFGGASQPDVLRWLVGPDGWIGSHDAVLVARGTGGGRLPERPDFEDHPRVADRGRIVADWSWGGGLRAGRSRQCSLAPGVPELRFHPDRGRDTAPTEA